LKYTIAEKTTMKTAIADILLKYLEAEGVEYVFGIPGTTFVPLLAAFNRNPAVKPILTKHEEGAAFMADGYARVKGTLGACMSTSGPGATNLVTGVANAYMDHVPMLVITGQVETTSYGKGTFQDSTREGIDSVKMFEPITQHSSMIISKQKAAEDIREALRRAMAGKKGPVHLSIPKDVQMGEVEFEGVSTSMYRVKPEYFDRRLVIEAAEQLVRAECPAILIGSGAVSSGACDEIRELAEMLNIPVATTPRAKGAFPEDHPLALGVLGLCGSPLAEKFIKSDHIDVLLVIGSSLNQLTTLSWDVRIVPSKCMIHVNIDPTEIGKNYATQVPLVGDAKTIISEVSFRVLRYLAKEEDRCAKRQEFFEEFKKDIPWCLEPEKMDSDHVPMKPQRLVKELQEALPEDAILFIDTGNSIAWGLHYMKFRKPDSLITPMGMLSMGHGVCAAVGGKLAAGDRPVVSLLGDGCFMMNGMEIATAVNYDVPVVWIVANNSKLGLVHDLQTFTLGKNNVITRFKEVRVADMARGMGAEAWRIEKPGELKALLPKAIALKKPAVIECMIDPNEVPPLAPFIEGVKDFVSRLNLV